MALGSQTGVGVGVGVGVDPPPSDFFEQANSAGVAIRINNSSLASIWRLAIEAGIGKYLHRQLN
ncbi:MAG TPA: hypothetical protein DIW54_14225 [Chitinophagaceae bacterium]|nr:hypothetical protein [Chitinophagaceae bacterium]